MITSVTEAKDKLSLLGDKTSLKIIKRVFLFLLNSVFWRSNYPNHTITKKPGNTDNEIEFGDHAFFFDENNVWCSGFYNGGENINSQSSFDINQN